MACAQKFDRIIKTLKAKEKTLLSSFQSLEVSEDSIGVIGEYIYSKIDPSSVRLDFDSLNEWLSELSNSVIKGTENLLYPGLTEDVRNDIESYVKYKHYLNVESLASNPRIKVNGKETELIDTTNISKLLNNDKSLENKLYSNIEKAVFTIAFRNDDLRVEDGFINFVVEDIALDHNIKVLKNDL